MKAKVTAESLGQIFERAHLALWAGKIGVAVSVDEQIKWWREQFHANITGGHFDNVNKPDTSKLRRWDTKSAVIVFDSKADFMLFMLEWS